MSPFSAIQIYDRLFERWGSQHWWPGRTRMEICVGAILTQNTNWKNVEHAISNLRKKSALNFQVLGEIPQFELAELIRSAGYFNIKAQRLKAFIHFLRDETNGSLTKLFNIQPLELRKKLLSVHGIGPETADSILLYAAKIPVFVVDAYTRRFMIRHGWCNEKMSYDEVAHRFTQSLPKKVSIFNEYHALIVQLAKEHCKTKPQCVSCPLVQF